MIIRFVEIGNEGKTIQFGRVGKESVKIVVRKLNMSLYAAIPVLDL